MSSPVTARPFPPRRSPTRRLCVAYDITDPAAPEFVTYVNNRDFSVEDPSVSAEALSASGDLGPEGLAFVPAADSPTGAPMLLVGNEVSGTTSAFAIEDLVEPVTPTPTPSATPAPVAAQPTGDGTSALAATGAAPLTAAATVLAFLAAGAALLTLRRRRA